MNNMPEYVVSFGRKIAFQILILTLSGCGPAVDVAKLNSQIEMLKSEVEALTLERNSLKDRVNDLSNTPQFLSSQVLEFVKDGKLQEAERALGLITSKFPQNLETKAAQHSVDALRLKVAKQEEELRRLESIGFKALKISPMVDTGSVKVSVGTPNFTKQFVFDRYNNSYHYRDADRDSKYLVVGLSATAAKGVSDPSLPGFAMYWADGKSLRKLGNFDLEFLRWEDYATYLGNYSDSRNDFAKSATIPFVIGMQSADEKMSKRPLYVVATTNGCMNRQYERFKNPPDFYRGTCIELEETLSLESFSAEVAKLTVVRRID